MTTRQHPRMNRLTSWIQRRWAGWLGGTVAVIGLVLVFGWLIAVAAPPPAASASIRAVLDDPGSYVGRRVAVSGQVGELLTHRAMTITGDSGHPLLVLVDESAVANAYAEAGDGGLGGYLPEAHGPLYRVGTSVRLTGTIERFDRASMADTLDMVLDSRLFGPYRGSTVLVVDALDLTQLIGAPQVAAGTSAASAGSPPAAP